MRVLFLTSKLNFETAGGSVMDLHLRAQGLLAAGHEVSVITAFSYKNIIKDELPYRVYEEQVFSRGLLGINFHALRILRKYAHLADAYHIDGQTFVYGAGLYRLLGGKAPVTGFFNVRLNCWADTSGNQTNISFFRRVKRTLRRLAERIFGLPIANRMDAFIFNTPMLQKLYFDWGFDQKKSVIIEDFVDMRSIVEKNGISPSSIEQKQHGARELTLVSAGRMLPEKGFELILRAIASQSDKKFRVVLSGDGPDRARLIELAKKLGISERVEFPGWVDRTEFNEIFARAHVFIFPRWWIEYGSALLHEAFAFGLPCIIPGGGAIEWLSKDAALTFQNENWHALAERLEEIRDEALRIRLARASFERVPELDCRELSKRLNALIESSVRK